MAAREPGPDTGMELAGSKTTVAVAREQIPGVPNRQIAALGETCQGKGHVRGPHGQYLCGHHQGRIAAIRRDPAYGIGRARPDQDRQAQSREHKPQPSSPHDGEDHSGEAYSQRRIRRAGHGD